MGKEIKESRIDYLFNNLKLELNRADLKMDYNRYYGGYIIVIVKEHGAEGNFCYANRVSKKEWFAF